MIDHRHHCLHNLHHHNCQKDTCKDCKHYHKYYIFFQSVIVDFVNGSRRHTGKHQTCHGTVTVVQSLIISVIFLTVNHSIGHKITTLFFHSLIHICCYLRPDLAAAVLTHNAGRHPGRIPAERNILSGIFLKSIQHILMFREIVISLVQLVSIRIPVTTAQNGHCLVHGIDRCLQFMLHQFIRHSNANRPDCQPCKSHKNDQRYDRGDQNLHHQIQTFFPLHLNILLFHLTLSPSYSICFLYRQVFPSVKVGYTLFFKF